MDYFEGCDERRLTAFNSREIRVIKNSKAALNQQHGPALRTGPCCMNPE
jgi:hypothetical protein